jgi:hypothetical protein
MSLAFDNLTNEDIWVAYMFLSQDVCRGEGHDWQAIGWFHLPGVQAHEVPHHAKGPSAVGSNTRTVYANDLRNVNNRYWYYYAQNASGSVVWAGPVSVHVSNQAFNHCIGEGRTDWWIAGFRRLDLGSANNAVIYLTA